MALRQVESVNAPVGYIPALIGGNLGQTSQSITTPEVTTELTSRGYRMTSAPISPPVSPPIRYITTPAITKAQAIVKGVDEILAQFRMSKRCTSYSGCPLTEYRFKDIVNRSLARASYLLRAGSVTVRTASISPAVSPYITLRGLSPRLRGIGGTLYGLGQGNGAGVLPGFQPVTYPPVQPIEEPGAPGMSKSDWVVMIMRAVQGVASTTEAYFSARAARERVGQTATLTAEQVKAVVGQALISNPTLNRAQLTAAAAGAGGQAEPTGMPSWIIPAVVGIGVVAFMSSGMGRRRR